MLIKWLCWSRAHQIHAVIWTQFVMEISLQRYTPHSPGDPIHSGSSVGINFHHGSLCKVMVPAGFIDNSPVTEHNSNSKVIVMLTSLGTTLQHSEYGTLLWDQVQVEMDLMDNAPV